MTRALLWSTLVALTFASSPALATGFRDTGEDIEAAEDVVVLDGVLRFRGELLHNLDLDTGLTPSGEPFFPVPLGDADGQVLTHADLRLRTDLGFFAPAGGLAVKLRIDVLDNLSLGSTPNDVPSVASSQLPPEGAFRVERAYGEALTPLGLFAVGRMGHDWGIGLLASGGDCADCDSGDAADRLAFVTPLFGHIWALAYDFSAIGPTTPRAGGTRAIDLDPGDDVRTINFAALHYTDDLVLERRLGAGKTTVDYGAWVSHRWQDRDVPAHYLAAALPSSLTATDVMRRDFTATATDGWLRVVHPWFEIEVEGALMLGRIGQASLIPGVELHTPLTTTAFGLALESAIGPRDAAVRGGLDAGFASGDDAPGFGAFPSINDPAPQPGDLDGAQAYPPGDTTADNFRFHPDYRIDRILFRELVGTVTDAFYVRPHVRWRLLEAGPSTLTLSLAAVASFAVQPASTPGNASPLGVELDPTLTYSHAEGFTAALEHAILFPLAGMGNGVLGVSAQPAQLVRLRTSFAF